MERQQYKFVEERRKQQVAAFIPRLRVPSGELVAEMIVDRRTQPTIVHCVVQRQGSSEILFLDQFYTLEGAESAAEQFMAEYASENLKAQA